MAGVAGDQRGAAFIALTEHLESSSEPTAVNGFVMFVRFYLSIGQGALSPHLYISIP